MIPPQSLLKQHYDSYDSYVDSYMIQIEGYDPCSEACLGSDLVVGHMAEDESRTTSLNEAGSNSKDVQEERDEGWLQLGIGVHVAGRDDLKLDPVEPTSRRGGLVELDLLPPGGTSNSSSAQDVKPIAPIFPMTEFRAHRPTSIIGGTPLFLQHQRTNFGFPQPEVTWGYGPNPWNPSLSSPSSSVLPGPYYARQFQYTGLDVAGPSTNVRVVDAPARPHSGVWFVLQASQNQ